MEDDLKLLKAEHFSNHLLDPTQISNLSLYDQILLIFLGVNKFGGKQFFGVQIFLG